MVDAIGELKLRVELLETGNATITQTPTLNITNQTAINQTMLNQTLINQTLINQTLLNETLINATQPVNETIRQPANQTVLQQRITELEQRIITLETILQSVNGSVAIKLG